MSHMQPRFQAVLRVYIEANLAFIAYYTQYRTETENGNQNTFIYNIL